MDSSCYVLFSALGLSIILVHVDDLAHFYVKIEFQTRLFDKLCAVYMNPPSHPAIPVSS
jgi:hypothetical protein